MSQDRSNRLFDNDIDIKTLFQDTLKRIEAIRACPMFTERGREIAIDCKWMDFWKKTHELNQSHQGRRFQSTRNGMEEQGHIADVIPMEECVPDVPISSCSISGTAMETSNADSALHSLTAGATTTLDSAIPVASIAKGMELQRLALPWQVPLPPLNPQMSSQFDFLRAGSTVTPSSGDSAAEVQTSISNDRPNLVAERNEWQKKTRINGHKQIKSSGGGLFPCLEGCADSSFGRARDRERHYRSCHRKYTPFICPDCNAHLSRNDSLKRHRKNRVCKKVKGSTV